MFVRRSVCVAVCLGVCSSVSLCRAGWHVCLCSDHFHTVYLQVCQSVLSPVYVVCLFNFGSFVGEFVQGRVACLFVV